jgi:hypothetical protein
MESKEQKKINGLFAMIVCTLLTLVYYIVTLYYI